jgi:hypothetical protein
MGFLNLLEVGEVTGGCHMYQEAVIFTFIGLKMVLMKVMLLQVL